jgi:hypothetical protein
MRSVRVQRLREFLVRHQDSIAELRMSNVTISDGTWTELGARMRNMPKLKSLELSGLAVDR